MFQSTQTLHDIGDSSNPFQEEGHWTVFGNKIQQSF